jgi:hypothetical protein
MTKTNDTAAEGRGDSIIAIGQHLNEHPNLPRVYMIRERYEYEEATEIRLLSSGNGAKTLAAWAATLSDVESYARRITKDQVDGHVNGVIGGHRVEIVCSVPGQAFPDEGDRHEWDVHVQLQEA